METNPSRFNSNGSGADLVKGMNTDDFPVESVSWDDAQRFVLKVNALLEKQRARLKVRLPTEAEWEYACRGGASGKNSAPFYFDGPAFSLDSTLANFNGDYPYGGASKRPFLRRTCHVGSYRRNAFGLHDMHGNVWEWCEDWYGEYPKGKSVDFRGPDEGSGRVDRGGDWIGIGGRCRAGYRIRSSPGDRFNDLGIRLAAVSQVK